MSSLSKIYQQQIHQQQNGVINSLINAVARSDVFRSDLDYHVLRAAMVIIFAFFGYQKWFEYEFERLVPFISNGPLIFWLYPVFGHGGAHWVPRSSGTETRTPPLLCFSVQQVPDLRAPRSP